MLVKIQSTTQEMRQIQGDPSGTWYTGIKVNGEWFNIEGDHKNLYNKTVDLEFKGKMAMFAKPQTPPAPAQTPPAPPPPRPTSSNGHTPRWPSRTSAVAAYIFYAVEIEQYIKDPYALVRAANCLMMMEKDGEINPVHEVKAKPKHDENCECPDCASFPGSNK